MGTLPTLPDQNNRNRSLNSAQPTSISWKAWISGGLAAVLTGVMSLAAPGAAAASKPEATSGPVTITYGLWDPVEEIGYEKSISEFEKTHPDIHVVIQQVPSADYYSKMSAEFAAGDAPDVLWTNPGDGEAWYDAHDLMDLTSKIKAAGINLNQYYQALIPLHEVNGQLYGLPKDWDTIALFYNKAYFAKMHVTMPASLAWNPTNGGSFVKLLDRLEVDGSGLHPDQKGFNAGTVKTWAYLVDDAFQTVYGNYLAMNGASMVNNSQTALAVNTPQAKSAFQFLVDLMYKYYVAMPEEDVGTVVPGSDTAIDLFTEGKVAVIDGGDWQTGTIVKDAKFPVGIAELPAGPDGRWSVFNGLSDAINAHTKYPEQAWQLFQWLASPQSESILGSGGYIWPGIKSLDPLFAKAWAKKGVDMEPFLAEASGHTTSGPTALAYNTISDNVTQTLLLMFLHNLTVDQAVQEMMTEDSSKLAHG